MITPIWSIALAPPPGVSREAAKEALRRGVFGRMPLASVIGRLVDIGVERTIQEAIGGRGSGLRSDPQGTCWQVVAATGRNHYYLGTYSRNRLSASWRQACHSSSDKSRRSAPISA